MIPLLPSDPVSIGTFELLARLGTGGMGQLYLGRRPDRTTAAIKLIRPDLAHQKDFRARFRREIAAASQAAGPFIGQVVASDPDGSPPWLAVEYLTGPSLTDVIDQHGKLPETTVRPLMAGLAAGLAHLHELGLVHRDLKPGNVLITEDGPHIIDFGVSRVLDSSTITQTGQLLGSPGFMSPEQALGTSTPGLPTDVFALGALISYVLTGTSPFGTGQTPAIVYRIVHEQPTLDGVPESLRDLLTSCLAKNPADRPTAREVADRLEPANFPAGWLPPEVSEDIRSRTTELKAIQDPLRDESAETTLRPRTSPAPAAPQPEASPRRTARRSLLMVGAAAVVLLAAGGGTAVALSGSPPKAALVLPASSSPAPSPTSSRVPAPQDSAPPTPSDAAQQPAPGTSTVIVVRPPTAESTITTGARPAAPRPTTPKAAPKSKPKTVQTPTPRRTADGSSCFSTAIKGGFELENGVHVAGGPNYTSSKCRDIHIKLTSAITWTYARSCLETADGGRITKCSGWVYLSYPNTWDTLSTNVPAGTRWQLQMYARGDESARFSYTA
ncbi:MAG: protein kinase [Actinoplanes sp.]